MKAVSDNNNAMSGSSKIWMPSNVFEKPSDHIIHQLQQHIKINGNEDCIFAYYDASDVLDFSEKSDSFLQTFALLDYIQKKIIKCDNNVNKTETIPESLTTSSNPNHDVKNVQCSSFPLSENSLQVILIVKKMSDFSQMNHVYSQFFGGFVPSRVCIENNQIKSCIQAEIKLLKNGSHQKSTKEVLHVQSISEWAPACIGPYSQATLDNTTNIIRMAGQIPLIPPTMALVSDDIKNGEKALLQHMDQCLQNIAKILPAIRSNISKTFKCLIYYDYNQCKHLDISENFVREHWKRFLEKSKDVTAENMANVEKMLIHTIPVSHLPKSSCVEYQVYACRHHEDVSIHYNCKEFTSSNGQGMIMRSATIETLHQESSKTCYFFIDVKCRNATPSSLAKHSLSTLCCSIIPTNDGNKKLSECVNNLRIHSSDISHLSETIESIDPNTSVSLLPLLNEESKQSDLSFLELEGSFF